MLLQQRCTTRSHTEIRPNPMFWLSKVESSLKLTPCSNKKGSGWATRGEMHIVSGQHHGCNDEQHYLFPVQQVILSGAIHPRSPLPFPEHLVTEPGLKGWRQIGLMNKTPIRLQQTPFTELRANEIFGWHTQQTAQKSTQPGLRRSTACPSSPQTPHNRKEIKGQGNQSPYGLPIQPMEPAHMEAPRLIRGQQHLRCMNHILLGQHQEMAPER